MQRSTISRFRKQNLPPARAFYERELGRVGRPNSKGWAPAICPFHPDHHPSLSVNIHHGGYVCHSCTAKGDMVRFVQQRYSLTFRDAAIYLGAWETSTVSTEQARIQRQALEAERVQREVIEYQKFRARMAARDWVHTLDRCEVGNTQRMTALGRGAEPLVMDELEQRWTIAAGIRPRIRVAEMEYFQLSGIDYEQ